MECLRGLGSKFLGTYTGNSWVLGHSASIAYFGIVSILVGSWAARGFEELARLRPPKQPETESVACRWKRPCTT